MVRASGKLVFLGALCLLALALVTARRAVTFWRGAPAEPVARMIVQEQVVEERVAVQQPVVTEAVVNDTVEFQAAGANAELWSRSWDGKVPTKLMVRRRLRN